MPALSNSISSDPHLSSLRPSSSHGHAGSQWIFTEDELLLTPSILAGLKPTDERSNRAKGVNFIQSVGILLKLPQITLSTASVFLHRFFMRYSMKKDPTGKKPDFHYYSVAAAALWLAAKVEENCRKMKDLVVACVRIAQKNPDKVVDEQDKEFWRWRDTILALEDRLLEGLCFDLSIEPPYLVLYDFMKKLGKAEDKVFRNAAWAFLNDSLMTPICLLHYPKVIAAAAIYAAARSPAVKFERDEPDGKPWWTSLGVDVRDIKKACNFMAGVYENAPLKDGAAEGMYARTPEDGHGESESRTALARSTRESSIASAAGSDMSKKRPISVNDVPWSGEDERTAKRKKLQEGLHEAINEGSAEKVEEYQAAKSSRTDTNGSRPNGSGINLDGVPPEAGPEIKDKTPVPVPEYNGPVSPDLGGSEEGELEE